MVSALVCTCNRSDSLVRAVASLLRDDNPDLELLIVDQSEGVDSCIALRPFSDDPRLRYIRASVKGKGVALNEGLRLARGEIVVCTDDDCEATPGWISNMAQALSAVPGAAVVFCNVTALPHDNSLGYVPAFQITSARALRSLSDAGMGIGLGAGMAFRRGVVTALGGFDEMFGPGSRFSSGDDWDLSVRVILRGWHVYQAAHLAIGHHGFRTWAEGRAHARRDWFAIGALTAKPLRAGHVGALKLAARLFGTHALLPPLRDLMRLRRPRGLTRVTAFAHGFLKGLSMPVDRKTLRFR